MEQVSTQTNKSPVVRGLRSGSQEASAALDLDRLAVARASHGIADLAVDEREQRVVTAGADVLAGVELGAALANDDRAGRHRLAAEHLDAEHLRLRVAAVARRAAAFFLCHLRLLELVRSGGVDRADLDLGERLPVALALAVVLALAHLEDADLGMAAMADDARDDAGASHE